MRLPSGVCIVQTVDFFTPVVDDPYTYGAIAAANALSDVWAMGGRPISAMNIVSWPKDLLPPQVLGEILRGGADKTREAGAAVVGGHSVTGPELLFGLAVTGIVEEEKIWTNAGAKPGDALVLTKPLGTGVLSTAIKRGACSEDAASAVTASMLLLNRAAAEAAADLEVHAATDVTGYGLVGHGWEMARASRAQLHIRAVDVPLLPWALEAASRGFLTGGERRNPAYVGEALHCEGVDSALRSILVDPQTSGGLLLALPPSDAATLVGRGTGVVIGDVRAGRPGVWFR